jgi:pilus assembly protein CpaC
MNTRKMTSRARLGTAIAAMAFGIATVAGSAPVQAQPSAFSSGTYRPAAMVALSTGEGQMITLPRAVADVWVSNPKVADVYVTNNRQLKLFGKDFGEATVIATASDGSVVYGAQIKVSQNLPSIAQVLKEAMPDSDVHVTVVGQTAILSGTVASPDDSTFALNLAERELNPGVDMNAPGAMCKICVLNRLKTATPLQVTLKVRIVEVNRSLLKSMGVNLLSHDSTGGFNFGIGRGNPGTINGPNSASFNINPTGTTLGAFGHLLGLDILGTLDVAASDGLATTLAEPNLTALSGETASFLAGGEFPIPVSQSSGGGSGAITIEYKQYGVGLAFTPIVLSDGRISMRVRPEVSQLDDANAVVLSGTRVPALITRRAETTVELGSGQSFMIAGLLQNMGNNSVDKTPLLGDLPILGALFRSTKFQRQETELVVVVTPYLVRPVSGQLAVPTDGYRSPNDIKREWFGQTFTGVNGRVDPTAVAAPTGALPAPAISGGSAAPGFKM